MAIQQTTRRFGLPPNNLFQLDPKSGEWQRVLSAGNQHGALLDLRPRAQRVRDELTARHQRHSQITLWVPLTIAIVGLLYYLIMPLPDGPWSPSMIGAVIGKVGRLPLALYQAVFGSVDFNSGNASILSVIGSGIFFCALIYGLYQGIRHSAKLLADEFAHALGFQFVAGARVLDPEPVQLGLIVVENQKAHGAARLASEKEARAAASQGGVQSAVHDQDF